MQKEESNLMRRTKPFALHIVRLFSALPKLPQAQVIGCQMLPSGTARSKPEFIAKCGDALRDLEETAYWLELLEDAQIVPCEPTSLIAWRI